jgi:hypothetical protein
MYRYKYPVTATLSVAAVQVNLVDVEVVPDVKPAGAVETSVSGPE